MSDIFDFLVSTPCIIFIDGLPSDQLLTIHWPNALLPASEPDLMPQSLSSEVSNVRLVQHGSTESARPLLGLVKHKLVNTFLPICACIFL